MSNTDVPAHGGKRPAVGRPDSDPQRDSDSWWGSGPQRPAPSAEAPPPPPPALQRTPPPGRRYPRGRVAAIIAGVLLVLAGVVSLGAGGTSLWADLAARHNGYLTVAAADYRTSGYAMTSDRITLWGNGHLWYQASLIGDVRITVTRTGTGTNPTVPLFVGIAPADAAQAYLANVSYSTLTHLSGGRDTVIDHPGATRPLAPSRSSVWTASATGTGTQTLTWPSSDGTWMLVVMNADGSAPVSAHVDLGITAPSLAWIGATLLAVAALFLTAGVLLITIPTGRAARERATASPTPNR